MNCWRLFFSSRRRHTRLQGDWSSDVCSSDLFRSARPDLGLHEVGAPARRLGDDAVRSEERREGKSVDLGGRRIIKKKTRRYVNAEAVNFIGMPCRQRLGAKLGDFAVVMRPPT